MKKGFWRLIKRIGEGGNEMGNVGESREWEKELRVEGKDV